MKNFDLTMWLSIYLTLAAAFAPSQPGQAQDSLEAKNPASVVEKRALVQQLELTRGIPVEGIETARSWMMPTHCSPEGKLYLQAYIPEDPKDRPQIMLSPAGGKSFDLSHVPGLYHLLIFDLFPVDREVVFLVEATEDPAACECATGQSACSKTKVKDRPFYLVLTDPSGNYKSTIKLPSDIYARRVAELATGEFILLGHDKVDNRPRLERVGRSGEFLQEIPIPSKMLDDSVVSDGVDDNVTYNESVAKMGTWHFVPAMGRVLLFKPRAAAPVLEINSESGEASVRQVFLNLPEHYELEKLLPANDHWFAALELRTHDTTRPGDVATEHVAHLADFLLADVSPADGTVRALFASKHGSLRHAECEANGSLIGLEIDDESQYLFSQTRFPE